jgi:hypothetical protein
MRVELIRVLIIGSEAAVESSEGRTDNHIAIVASRAYFWSVHEPGEDQNRRILQGEVDLEMELKPTFIFPGLSVEVSVFTYFRMTAKH